MGFFYLNSPVQIDYILIAQSINIIKGRGVI